MNALNSKAYRCALISLVLIALAGCATSDISSWPGTQSERRAQSLAANGRFQDSASVYIGLAGRAVGQERDRLTLLAVEQWLNAGDERRARNALREVPVPASGELLWLWSANTAALSLWGGQPDSALNLLEPMSRLALPTDHRVRIEALRADAWFQKRDPSQAIRLLTQREAWLDGDQEIIQNRKRLWDGLLVSDLETLRSALGLPHQHHGLCGAGGAYRRQRHRRWQAWPAERQAAGQLRTLHGGFGQAMNCHARHLHNVTVHTILEASAIVIARRRGVPGAAGRVRSDRVMGARQRQQQQLNAMVYSHVRQTTERTGRFPQPCPQEQGPDHRIPGQRR